MDYGFHICVSSHAWPMHQAGHTLELVVYTNQEGDVVKVGDTFLCHGQIIL